MKDEAYILMRTLEDSHWWYRARREIVCDVIARCVPGGSRILDYGCGTGSTARALHDLGYLVTAADVSDHALAACRDEHLPTLDLRTHRPDTRSADAILAGDVLEHVHDDEALLADFSSWLRPGGTLVLTVPAYQFLWSGEDVVSEHLRRYTRMRLLEKVETAGFEVVRSSYFNTLLFPAAAGVILFKRLFAPAQQRRSNVSMPPAFLNRMCYRIFRTERLALRRVRFHFGLSILVIARSRVLD